MQQSVVGKEMLVNHKWNDEMVKWNNGNEYVIMRINVLMLIMKRNHWITDH